MTFRVRPADRGRSGRDHNRRNLYMNIGFGLATIVAVLILVAVGVTSWYSQHLAPAATIDGQTITKDQLAERALVEAFRLQQESSRITADLAAGRLTAAEASTRATDISNQLSSNTFVSTVLEKLIDTSIQAKLAANLGVTVPVDEIDKRILEDKTRKEERHVWLIAVKPVVDSGKTDPTDVQKIAARQIADNALAGIKSGSKTFEDTAKAVSTDTSKTSGGDLGWLTADASEDPAWLAAVFKLDANGVTDVILGADGTYRIGRVSEIAPAEADAAWDQKLADAKVSQAAYRAAIQSEALRTALEDRLIADDSKSGPQRRVVELFIAAPTTAPGDKAIKVRHILYSPNGDPRNASTVPDTDPAWTVAGLAATKAYNTIKADPSLFDSIARKESNETGALGDSGTGGKLPYFDTSSGVDQAFADQIFKDGLKPGDLIPPFKSSFGWHVVQVMYRPPDLDEMNTLKAKAAAGTPFADLVRDFSDGPKAGIGGEIGWVTTGQLDNRLTAAISAAQLGGLTDVVDVPGDGLYLFKVLDEKTAAPDADQLTTITSNAFRYWYAEKKDAVKITRDVLGAGQ
jgi:parvulin-like peptidyl-prolyl isomerase